MPPVEDVMYKGGPLAVQAITAGEVQLYGASTLDVASLHKAGKLRVIAYAEKQRHPLLPDVPTIAETNMGINDFEAGFWFALMGPANMPGEVIARLSTAMQGTLKDPEFTDKVISLGHRVYSMNPAESRAYIQNYLRQLEQAQAAGVKLR
jgi:tripartite-type tricarboxylate transporter receptor subunit TctC